MPLVQLYTRITENGKRKYVMAAPKKQITPAGTVYCLRYDIKEFQPDGSVRERRVWETVGSDRQIAQLKVAQREAELLESNTRKAPAPALKTVHRPTLKELRASFYLVKKEHTKKERFTFGRRDCKSL